MTQGRGDGAEWVTSYLVSFSIDAYHWQYITDQYGNQRVSTLPHKCQSEFEYVKEYDTESVG